ncbi:hypothetical protein FHS61_002231 [Altererythrobacter atlanticus]|uniref:Uncharacterized protein n=1 Tax=Croceibacterium atlanticum TaxID=1267766 RepID=A0A0F7KRB1_9SPHN|nr:hypothetical protein [Croceibacterium atlanticum]AKH41742.1 hypothetical protein WYH_00686 [Croceibacterium atlanticum]MBB5733205.1 hypothetical protein [Croceibacterium atlanticum]
MTDHPSTFRGEGGNPEGIEWDDHATVHEKGDGRGVLDGFKALHSGTLAEMVALVSRLPEEERAGLVIQKAGDHLLGPAEIMALASRKDFPG